MPKIKWDPKQNPREFLDKSKDTWIKRPTGRDSRPLSGAPLGATAPTFAATTQRQAVSEGEGRMERGTRKGWKRNEGVSILQQVTSQQEGGQHTPPPEVEWVLLRVIKRKWSEPRWTGPFQVTERTSHAVRLRGKGDTWFHWSQCAAAEEQQRSLSEIQTNLQEKSTESADSETDPTSTKGAE
uniref:Murine leukemia virus integrase C-terminal domain-containing protein n=1 Tax=Larimichthys crocea TaxID=215358 RepID=A0A0F8AB66_LARCR